MSLHINYAPIHYSTMDAWVESEHKRGQPKNKGQFAKGSGGQNTKSGQTESNPGKPSQASPLTDTHYDVAKHMQNMGHATSGIKIERSISPNTSLNSKPYHVVGEVHPETGAVLYTLEQKPMSTSASIAHNLSELKGSFSRNEKAIVRQEVSNIDELYQKAKQSEPSFKKAVEDIAKLVGGMPQFTPAEYAEPGTTLKSRKSAERKLAEYNGDASQLLDIVRGTVSCNTVEEVRTAAKAFIDQHKEQVVKVKDRIVMPVQGGYRDILINFRTDTGVIAELQFNSDEMIKAKLGDGHRIYEALRVLNTREHPDIHKRMVEFLEMKSEEVYQTAYKQSGDGDWK